MKKGMILILSVASFLIGGSIISARATGTNDSKQTTQSTAQTKAKPTVHQLTGTVSSVTASELVLDHAWKGKEERTTIMLNSGTKKEADVEKGTRATVYYHVENNQRVATDVKVPESKSKTGAKKS